MLMALRMVLSLVCILAGGALLVVAVVIVVSPRWYRRRWGKPRSGRLASYNSVPFALSHGRRKPSLYFWAGYGAPFDDLVDDPELGEPAIEEWLQEQEALREQERLRAMRPLTKGDS